MAAADSGGDDDAMDGTVDGPPRRAALPRLRVAQAALEADAELRQLAEKTDPQWLERVLQRACARFFRAGPVTTAWEKSNRPSIAKKPFRA